MPPPYGSVRIAELRGPPPTQNARAQENRACGRFGRISARCLSFSSRGTPMRLRRTFTILALCMAATAAVAALKAGDTAPAFTAPASLAGKPFTYSLKDGLAKGPVVVY